MGDAYHIVYHSIAINESGPDDSHPFCFQRPQWLSHLNHDMTTPAINTEYLASYYWLQKQSINIYVTELTAHVLRCFVTGWIPLSVTIHTPQPPSRHINFVPRRCAWFLMNVLSDVSTEIALPLTAKNFLSDMRGGVLDMSHISNAPKGFAEEPQWPYDNFYKSLPWYGFPLIENATSMSYNQITSYLLQNKIKNYSYFVRIVNPSLSPEILYHTKFKVALETYSLNFTFKEEKSCEIKLNFRRRQTLTIH